MRLRLIMSINMRRRKWRRRRRRKKRRRMRRRRRKTYLLMHRMFIDLHVHLLVWHLPVQWHLRKPWPPPMDSSLAAVLTGTSLSIFTSNFEEGCDCGRELVSTVQTVQFSCFAAKLVQATGRLLKDDTEK